MLRDPTESGGAARDTVVIYGGICGPTIITSAEGVSIRADDAGRYRFFVEMRCEAQDGEGASTDVLGVYKSHDEALAVAAPFVRNGCTLDDQLQTPA